MNSQSNKNLQHNKNLAQLQQPHPQQPAHASTLASQQQLHDKKLAANQKKNRKYFKID